MSRRAILSDRAIELEDTLIQIVSDECEYFKVDRVKTDNIIREFRNQFYDCIYEVIEKSMKERKHPNRVVEFLIGIGVGSVVVIGLELILYVRG